MFPCRRRPLLPHETGEFEKGGLLVRPCSKYLGWAYFNPVPLNCSREKKEERKKTQSDSRTACGENQRLYGKYLWKDRSKERWGIWVLPTNYFAFAEIMVGEYLPTD